MRYKIYRHVEIWVAVFIAIVLCFVALVDIFHVISLKICLISEETNVEILMNTLFSVQALVATLGLTVVSFISQSNKDDELGVSISKYITHDKPNIFKLSWCILSELAMIFAGYVSLSFHLYNVLVSLLFVSITIIIMLVLNVFSVLQGQASLRSDLDEYLDEKLYQRKRTLFFDFLSGLSQSAVKSANKNDLPAYQDAIDRFVMLAKSLDKEDEELLKIYNEQASIVARAIFLSRTGNIVVYFLRKLYEIYDVFNQSECCGTIKILDNNWFFFYKAISVLSKMEIDDASLPPLQDAILRNAQFDRSKIEGKGKSLYANSYLGTLSAGIYHWSISKSSQGWNEDEKHRFMSELYEFAIISFSFLSSKSKSPVLSRLATTNLLNLAKCFIDNGELDILHEKIFERIHTNITGVQDQDYYFTIILIYIYFSLTVPENSQVQKESAYKIIETGRPNIQNFMYGLRISSVFTREFITYAEEEMDRWEFSCAKNSDIPSIDAVIEEFVLLSLISKYTSEEELRNQLNMIVETRSQSIIAYKLFLGKKKKQTIKKLQQFQLLFFGENNENKEDFLAGRVEDFEVGVKQLVKKFEIEEARSNARTTDRDREYIGHLTALLDNMLNEMFSDFASECDELRTRETDPFIITFDQVIMNNLLDNEIRRLFHSTIVRELTRILLPYLAIQYSDFESTEFLDNFFRFVESQKLDLNTIVGYRNRFWHSVRSDEFSLFEQGKLLINDASFQNQIIIIDRQEICIRIKSLNVRILDFTDSEIVGQSIVSSKEQYIFSIDKDIAIPFEKDELLDYYSNRKKRLAISAVIEYGSKKDRIGIGLLNKDK